MNDIKFILICVLVIIVFIIFRIYKFFYNKNLYEATTYFHITNIPYLQILNDVGHYGEYQIYKHLRYLELENTIIHDIMLFQSKTLSTEDIFYIYNKLYLYSQVDKDTKVQHIKNLKLK